MENTSGIQPVRYHCLIKMPPKEEVTKGGIILPEMQNERHELAREIGTFISSGGIAFTGGDGAPPWPKWNIPKPGQKVLFNRYAGSVQKGKDGELYRLIDDTELGAIVEGDYEG